MVQLLPVILPRPMKRYGRLLLPPSGNGQLVGSVDGYNMKFTMVWDSGTSESGTGVFSM